jgi:hypothetical protein
VFQVPELPGHDSGYVLYSGVDTGQAMIQTVFPIPEWTGHDSDCVSDSGVDRPLFRLCVSYSGVDRP